MLIDKNLRDWISGAEPWCSFKKTKVNNEIERNFILGYHSSKSVNQWSNSFGEELVKTILQCLEKDPFRPKKIHGVIPDLETKDALYEIKTRNWTTSGTAGEKILAAPYKYKSISRLTGKKIFIVLVGFQEYEAIHSFKLFEKDQETLEYKQLCDQWNIEFIKCSDLIKLIE